MPILRYAWSVKVTAKPQSVAWKLPGGPNSLCEIVNTGTHPVYVAPGNSDKATVEPIDGTPRRSIYIPPGAAVEIRLHQRSHLAVLCPKGTSDLIVMQGGD